MDKASVAHLFGNCFAEALRERVEDNGGYANEQTVAAEMSRQYRIPAEYIQRVTGYALSTGAVEITERADGGATVENAAGYEARTERMDYTAAIPAVGRGDYPVSYGPQAGSRADTRPRTPATLFPEATKDTVTTGEAEVAPRTSGSGRDDVDTWGKACRARRDENARIIASQPAPQRTDFDADPLAEQRERMEAQSQQERQANTRKANARRNWTEADRLINWLYQRPGRMQEIRSLYYERGAHSPEQQEVIRAALNELQDQKKVRSTRRNGKRVAVLVEGVRPRRYSRADFQNTPEQEISEEEEQQGEHEVRSQSFGPQVMAEMTAAGASYTEVWDS